MIWKGRPDAAPFLLSSRLAMMPCWSNPGRAICRTADILVAAVRRPEMIRGDRIKLGATVIDVGINWVPQGDGTRLVSDVAFDETAHAAAFTPVPGGVGPMTIACLLQNTLTAFRRQHGVTA
jgi:methylenetetrahydrofolate dehydrogenase (NADP+) / methenyltetrahydrofolate cyclohydrolase